MLISPKEAVKILLNNGIVAIPTETVYGLAGLATSKEAIKKIYTAKNRPTDNPSICHFYNPDQIKPYTANLPKYFDKLVTNLSPGPVSYLLDLKNFAEEKNSDFKNPLLPATLGKQKVICRIPSHPICRQILKELNLPLAAPSANTSSKFSATTAVMVEADFGSKIDGVVDGGPSEEGIESTILDLTLPKQINILRPGAIGINEIKKALGSNFKEIEIGYKKTKITTPGSKYRHYSPDTPVFKLDSMQAKLPTNKNICLLANSSEISKIQESYPEKKYLDLGKSPSEVAHNFYSKLFELDKLKVDIGYIYLSFGKEDNYSIALAEKLDKIVQS